MVIVSFGRKIIVFSSCLENHLLVLEEINVLVLCLFHAYFYGFVILYLNNKTIQMTCVHLLLDLWA